MSAWFSVYCSGLLKTPVQFYGLKIQLQKNRKCLQVPQSAGVAAVIQPSCQLFFFVMIHSSARSEIHATNGFNAADDTSEISLIIQCSENNATGKIHFINELNATNATNETNSTGHIHETSATNSIIIAWNKNRISFRFATKKAV